MATPIIIAGLRRRTDRRMAIQSQLANRWPKEPLFASDLGLVADWSEWDQATINKFSGRTFPWRMTGSSNPWWNRDLKLGEIACTLTHWNIWKYAWDQNFPQLIVLEDDAELLPGFYECEGVIADLSTADSWWDLLYLGRERLEPDSSAFRNFRRPGFSYCTFGYVLSRHGIWSLLETRLADCVIPVDEFLPAMYLKHPRNDVNLRFPPQIHAYGLAGDIVSTKNDAAWGSDTEESPFATATPNAVRYKTSL